MLEYQFIVEDTHCIKNVLRVAYLGLTGAKSSAPSNKSQVRRLLPFRPFVSNGGKTRLCCATRRYAGAAWW